MSEPTWRTGATVVALYCHTLDEGRELVCLYADAESALEAMRIEILACIDDLDVDFDEAPDALALMAEYGGMASDGDFFVDLSDQDGIGTVWTTESMPILKQPPVA